MWQTERPGRLTVLPAWQHLGWVCSQLDEVHLSPRREMNEACGRDTKLEKWMKVICVLFPSQWRACVDGLASGVMESLGSLTGRFVWCCLDYSVLSAAEQRGWTAGRLSPGEYSSLMWEVLVSQILLIYDRQAPTLLLWFSVSHCFSHTLTWFSYTHYIWSAWIQHEHCQSK